MKLSGAAAEKLLRTPDRSLRAALFFGPNRARAEEAAQRFTSAWLGGGAADPYAITRLNEDELKRDRALLADALAAEPLFGGGGPRLVRVRCEGDAAADPIVAALLRLEAGQPAAAFLLVEAGDLSSRSKLKAAFHSADTAAGIAFYEDTPADLAAYARATAQDLRLLIEDAALEALLAVSPGDRGALRAELDKLALFAHGLERAVNEDDVRALAPLEAESALDEAVARALAGAPGPAVEALSLAEASGVTALKALERRLLRLLDAQTMIAQGTPADQVAGKVKPPVFWKEKAAFAQQLKVWTGGRLLRALERLWAGEIAAKTRSPMADLIAIGVFRDVAAMAAR